VRQRLVSDEIWEVIEPLLPPEPPKLKDGRPRLSDRAALEGIALVLATGTPWRELPGSPGSPSGITCWRRLKEWQRSGAWDAVHALLDSQKEEVSR
jgi:transposase